jgi:hypothetical protein
MQNFILVFVPILFLTSLLSFVVFLFRKMTLHFRLIKRIFPAKYGNTRNLSQFNWVFFMNTADIELFFWFYCPVFYKKSVLTQENSETSMIIKKLDINNIRLLFALFFLFGSIVLLFLL